MAKGSIQYGGIFKLPNLLPGGWGRVILTAAVGGGAMEF